MRTLVTRLREDGLREKVMVTDWPEPAAPVGNQVKTRTLYTGITNGTERNDLMAGNYATPTERLPALWGYQNVGEVIETGPDCKILQVGDVIFSSENHVEYATVPEDWLLTKLPSSVDPKQAALFGMASVAMRTCRNADVRLGERVLVVGAGYIGQVATQIFNVMGAKVSICDIDEGRLEFARQIGAAEHVFNSAGEGWAQNVQDFSYQVVADFAGVPGMEDRLIGATATRGRLMLIAGRFEVKYDFNIGQGHELCIKQNSHFDNSDLAELCRLVSRGMVQIGPLMQDIVPVEQAKGIYDTLRDDLNKLRGTVFVW